MWHGVWPGPRKHRGHISVLRTSLKRSESSPSYDTVESTRIWVTKIKIECKQEKGLRRSEHTVILFILDKFYF